MIAQILLMSLLACPSLAKPYFFWHEPAPAIANTNEISTSQLGESGKAPYEQQQGLGGHLGQLVSHSGSAMRNVVDTVQPDLKNIGKDISEALLGARDSVGKKIEPTLQSAGKTVVPLVKQAQEKVPEALSKVGQQVRGVWDKVASGASNLANSAQQQQQQPTIGNHLEKAGQQVSQTAQQAVQQVQAST